MKGIKSILILTLFTLTTSNCQEFIYNKKNDIFYFKPKGQKLDKSIAFNKIKYFNHYYFGVYNGDNWGVINNEGKLVIPLEYDGVEDIRDELFIVSKSNKVGVLNCKNEIIFDVKYSNILYNSMKQLELGYKGYPQLTLDGINYIYDIKSKTFSKEVKSEIEVYKIVEKMPILFEECMDEHITSDEIKCVTENKTKWARQIIKSLKQRHLRVIAEFIVMKTGEIKNIKIIDTNMESYNDQIEKEINDLKVFRVGEKNGRKVNVMMTMLIKH